MSPLDNRVGSVKTKWVYSFGDGTADGSAVVASVAFPDFVGTVYRWTLSDSGLTTETLPLDYAQVHGTNRDGSAIVGGTVEGAFRMSGERALGELCGGRGDRFGREKP